MRNLGMCEGLFLQERGAIRGEIASYKVRILYLQNCWCYLISLILWKDLDNVNNSHGIVPALLWVTVMHKQRWLWGAQGLYGLGHNHPVWFLCLLPGWLLVAVAATTLFSQVLLVLAENRSIWDWDFRIRLRGQVECSRFVFSSFGPP